MEQPCRTKYPILLVHGVFYRKDYWGRIPEALRKKGAVVHHSGHQATAAVADSGAAEADEKPGTDPITSASGVFGAVFGNFSLERSVSPKAGTGTDRTAQFDFHRL